MLHTVIQEGPAEAPPLLIVHGLFGSARNWGVIAKRLAAGRRVVAVDLRNHGESPWSDVHDYPAMAADLAEVMAQDPRPWDLLGHSMGGKAAMWLALTAPDRLRRLIVADIAPIAYRHSHAANFAAMARVDPARVTSRAEASAAMALDDPAVSAFLLQSLDLAEKRWRLNLPVLQAAMPAILGFPETQARFTGPTLSLRGGTSTYVEDSALPAFRARFPALTVETLAGAGHWLQAEAPAAFIAAASAFLESP